MINQSTEGNNDVNQNQSLILITQQDANREESTNALNQDQANISQDSKLQNGHQSNQEKHNMLKLLMQVARNPTVKIPSAQITPLMKAVTQHKSETLQTIEPETQILGKRLKGLPTESESKKRQRLQEMKDYEEGRRCLSPSVFRKSKGPIILTTQSAALTANSAIDVKGLNPGLKKGPLDISGLPKEISMQDFDINQCMDIKEVHTQMMKGFDNYLSMVSQLYYGLPISQHFGGKGSKAEPSSTNVAASSGNLIRKQQMSLNNGGQMLSNDSNKTQNGAQDMEIEKPIITQASNLSYIQPAALSRDENRFRMSTFDQLISPLRVDNPFEIWAPKEIALFESCMCIYGKNFSNFTSFITTKTEKQVIDFYQVWKKTSHYKCWKSKQDKRKVSSNQNEWIFQ